MKSPVPFLTDEQYAALPVAERALMWAASKVGVRESTGHNDGPDVAEFLHAAGLGEGNPWCQAFVTWCLSRAGYKFDPAWKLRASVYYTTQWARARGLLKPEPRRGQTFVWVNRKNGQWLGHTGWVTKVLPLGFLVTIEGNTDADGSREGNGVFRKRVRTVAGLRKNQLWGFIEWV